MCNLNGSSCIPRLFCCLAMCILLTWPINTNTFFPLFRTLALNDPQLQGLEAKTHIKLDYPTTKILPNLQQDHKVIVLAYVKICFDSSVLMVHVGCTPVVTISTDQKMTIQAWIALELVLIYEYIFFWCFDFIF